MLLTSLAARRQLIFLGKNLAKEGSSRAVCYLSWKKSRERRFLWRFAFAITPASCMHSMACSIVKESCLLLPGASTANECVESKAHFLNGRLVGIVSPFIPCQRLFRCVSAYRGREFSRLLRVVSQLASLGGPSISQSVFVESSAWATGKSSERTKHWGAKNPLEQGRCKLQ
jgi:hypothetical protein